MKPHHIVSFLLLLIQSNHIPGMLPMKASAGLMRRLFVWNFVFSPRCVLGKEEGYYYSPFCMGFVTLIALSLITA